MSRSIGRLSLLIFLLCCCGLQAQLRSKFTYQDKPQLEWSDFVGEVPDNATHIASANTGLGYEVKTSRFNSLEKPQIDVHAYFYASLSWKKDLPAYSVPLLKHEQLHFLITELHARKLRQAYNRYRPVKNIQKEVDFIYQKFENDRQVMQARYDHETRHGNNASRQQDWESYLNSELFKL